MNIPLESKRGNGFDIFKIYTSVKIHFESVKFDLFKYGLNPRCSIEKFQKRSDLYFFQKAAHEYNLDVFFYKCLSEIRLSRERSFWIRNVVSKENDLEYFRWKSYVDSYLKYLEIELSDIKEFLILKNNRIKFSDLFVSNDEKEDCIFLKWIVSHKYKEETILALQHAMNIFTLTGLNKKIQYEDIFEYYKKYLPFISEKIPEKKVIRNLIIDKFKGL